MIKSTVRTAPAAEATVDGRERSKGHASSFTLDRIDCARTEFSGASVGFCTAKCWVQRLEHLPLGL